MCRVDVEHTNGEAMDDLPERQVRAVWLEDPIRVPLLKICAMCLQKIFLTGCDHDEAVLKYHTAIAMTEPVRDDSFDGSRAWGAGVIPGQPWMAMAFRGA